MGTIFYYNKRTLIEKEVVWIKDPVKAQKRGGIPMRDLCTYGKNYIGHHYLQMHLHTWTKTWL